RNLICTIRERRSAMADLAIPDYLLIPETCKICGVYSPTWFTDSDLWNLIDEAGILCPACFITKAEKAGVKTTGWKLIPEERVEKAESEARQLREQLEEANASKVVNLYRQPEIDALRSQLERLQSGFDALCTAHADLGQQAAKLEAQLERAYMPASDEEWEKFHQLARGLGREIQVMQ